MLFIYAMKGKQEKMSLLSRYGRSSMTRYMLAKLAESQNNSELEREMVFISTEIFIH